MFIVACSRTGFLHGSFKLGIGENANEKLNTLGKSAKKQAGRSNTNCHCPLKLLNRIVCIIIAV